jgi:tRNA-specific 2-thiouridylase
MILTLCVMSESNDKTQAQFGFSKEIIIFQYLVDKPGYFRDIDNGRIVGEHSGIHQWTIGQRCRIGGQLKPYFVARKEPKSGDIFVVS